MKRDAARKRGAIVFKRQASVDRLYPWGEDVYNYTFGRIDETRGKAFAGCIAPS